MAKRCCSGNPSTRSCDSNCALCTSKRATPNLPNATPRSSMTVLSRLPSNLNQRVAPLEPPPANHPLATHCATSPAARVVRPASCKTDNRSLPVRLRRVLPQQVVVTADQLSHLRSTAVANRPPSNAAIQRIFPFEEAAEPVPPRPPPCTDIDLTFLPPVGLI